MEPDPGEDSISGNGSSRTSQLSIQCHLCPRECPTVQSFNTHLRRHNALRFSAIWVQDAPAGLSMCPHCGNFYKRLVQHRCPQSPPTTQLTDVSHPVVVAPAPSYSESVKSKGEGVIRECVVRSGILGLFQVHRSWRSPIAQISGALITGMELEEGFYAQAAFLALPGIVKNFSRLRRGTRPLDWLRTVAASPDKVYMILHQCIKMFSKDNSQPTDSGLRESEAGHRTSVKSRTMGLWREGKYKAAARFLIEAGGENSNQPPMDSERHKSILQTLYPPYAAVGEPLEIPEQEHILFVAPEDISQLLEQLDADKAKGVSAWSYRAIKSVFLRSQNPGASCSSLKTLLIAMFKGKLDHALWTSSRSVLIPKKEEGKFRPLAISDPFYRLLGKLITRQMKEVLEDHFCPIQFGCGVKGGCEIAARGIQVAMKANPDLQAVSLDLTNAFTLTPRRRIYDQLGIAVRFQKLLSVFTWFYGQPNILYDSRGKRIMEVTEGIMQGDPLSSFFFCLAVHPLLEEIKTHVGRIHEEEDFEHRLFLGSTVAFVDDVTLLVHGRKVEESVKIAEEIFGREGLILNRSKTQVIPSLRHEQRYVGTLAVKEVAVVLGSPIGHGTEGRRPVFSKWLQAITLEVQRVMEAKTDKFIKFNVLRLCVNSRLSYLVRVCDITPEFAEFTRSVDLLITRAILDLAELVEDQRQDGGTILNLLRQLPQRFGGLGVPLHSGWSAEKARFLSRQLTRRFFQRFYPEEASECRWRSSPMDALMRSVSEEGGNHQVGEFWWNISFPLEDSVGFTPVVPWVEPTPAEPLASPPPENPAGNENQGGYGDLRRDVKNLMERLYDSGRKLVCSLLAGRGERSWQSWFRSCKFKGSGRWLAGMSSNLFGEYQFTQNDQYTAALRLRLLCEPAGGFQSPCRLCGLSSRTGGTRGPGIAAEETKEEEEDSDIILHGLDCAQAQFFWYRRHNAIRDLLFSFLKSIGYKPMKEGEAQIDEDLRPDIVYDPGGANRTVLIDVAIVNPSSRSYRRLAPHDKDDAAAIQREKDKERHYQRLTGYKVVPFVVEATGRLGPKARDFLDGICDRQDGQRLAAFREQIGAKMAQFVTLQCNGMHNRNVFTGEGSSNSQNIPNPSVPDQ